MSTCIWYKSYISRYIVHQIDKKHLVPLYILRNERGDVLTGKFHGNQLVKINIKAYRSYPVSERNTKKGKEYKCVLLDIMKIMMNGYQPPKWLIFSQIFVKIFKIFSSYIYNEIKQNNYMSNIFIYTIR